MKSPWQKFFFRREDLHDLYFKKGLGYKKIGKIYGCSTSPVYRAFKKFGLKASNNKEHNGQWKGDKVKRIAVHDYIKYHHKKPKICKKCRKYKKFIDLSNKTGNYSRKFSDWQWLCRSCHMKYDYEKGLRKTSIVLKILDKKSGMVRCGNCGYRWHTVSKMVRICCPSCKASNKKKMPRRKKL